MGLDDDFGAMGVLGMLKQHAAERHHIVNDSGDELNTATTRHTHLLARYFEDHSIEDCENHTPSGV